MKAIYIPHYFNPETDLEKLNQELKDTYSVEYHKDILLDYLPNPLGTLLIVGNYTRKDKLEKLNDINERTNNNSL